MTGFYQSSSLYLSHRRYLYFSGTTGRSLGWNPCPSLSAPVMRTLNIQQMPGPVISTSFMIPLYLYLECWRSFDFIRTHTHTQDSYFFSIRPNIVLFFVLLINPVLSNLMLCISISNLYTYIQTYVSHNFLFPLQAIIESFCKKKFFGTCRTLQTYIQLFKISNTLDLLKVVWLNVRIKCSTVQPGNFQSTLW